MAVGVAFVGVMSPKKKGPKGRAPFFELDSWSINKTHIHLKKQITIDPLIKVLNSFHFIKKMGSFATRVSLAALLFNIFKKN